MKRLLATPVIFLAAVNFTNWFGFAGWGALLNNFARDAAGFSGADIGLLQSVREIPGFLAFTAIFFFMVMREQLLGYIALITLSFGVAITGFYPTLGGLLITTTIMSVGFHYLETVNQSLSLQLFPKAEAPKLMGKVASAGAFAQFIVYSGLALLWWSGYRNYEVLYFGIGSISIILVLVIWFYFPRFQGEVKQDNRIILKKRYGLYYALTMMSGARRQIFTAFAGFLLVAVFKFTVSEIAILMLTTAALNTILAPLVGKLVARIGERKAIMLENIVLVLVFTGYAMTDSHMVAAGLYVLDGALYSLFIAQRAYIQKIGDPQDMAPTAAVAFTINHVAAVGIPVSFGLLWVAKGPSIVFGLGVIIALCSLALSFLIPDKPAKGNETIFSARKLAEA